MRTSWLKSSERFDIRLLFINVGLHASGCQPTNALVLVSDWSSRTAQNSLEGKANMAASAMSVVHLLFDPLSEKFQEGNRLFSRVF